MLIQIDVHYLFKKIKSVENYAVFNKILLLFFVSYNNFLNATPS